MKFLLSSFFFPELKINNSSETHTDYLGYELSYI